ncbi:class I SAM-dependent methyltransferase [Rhodopila sp.]|uniref:class I SAM-dependent methyltransferase n=1 Tax=Rhodopila sp. TaxID=2480087 RepID=UPI002B63EF8A|nr:class I SAM-dependent methyltransferase [Rhodopila sp.]HVZ10663.1 class I SAM-dependent methyltransferase [Rhodopila sp.]
MKTIAIPVPGHLASDSARQNPATWIGPTAFWPPQYVAESAWLEHGPCGFWLIDAIRPSVLVELGTHSGFSYFSFCQAVQWLHLSTACYAVDTWCGDEHAGFYGEEVYSRVAGVNDQRYSGFSSLLRCRFDEALPYFGDSTIDLLHIDGRHHADDVLHDFEAWRPKLSSRGVVLFHDINVHEREFGVWRLWAELSAQYPSFSFLHGHGLGVLAVGPNIPVGLRPLLEAGPDETDLIRTAYARLGLAIRRQYELEFTHRSLDETIKEREHLRHENQALLAERGKLESEREKREQALQDAETAVQTLKTRLSDIENSHADLLASLDNQRAVADKQARVLTELRDSLAREADATQAARIYAQCIERSSFWRATGPLRLILDRAPPPMRLAFRRCAKALWWAVTPHRMPARIAFLRDRRRVKPSKAIALDDNRHLSTRIRAALELQTNDPDVIQNPGPDWFDPDYYLNQEPRLESIDVDPFTHYATIGWRQGRNPHPLFDGQWWLKHQSTSGDVEPLQHFLSQTGAVSTAVGANTCRGWTRSARDFGDVPTRVPVPYTPPDRGRFKGTQEAVILDRLKSVDILSLDIFDTALIRRVAHPTSVFDLVAAAARAIHPRFGTFADLRFWAEREARNIAQREAGILEIGFRHIYDVLQKELNLNDNERRQLEQLELDTERQMLCANPMVLGWYRAALATGKKTIFVSDMYLPSDFLTEVLSAAGYEDPVVYVSNEYGAGKWQRTLYEKVAADLGVSGEKILHLGDNFQADMQCAEASGWNAIHYTEHEVQQPYALQMADVSVLDISNLAASTALGLSREHRARIEAKDLDPTERIARHVGYEVLGPTALAFAGWIATRAKTDRLDKVLFLARDGFLVQQVYELIRKSGFAACASRYLLASRRMLYSQRLLTIDGLESFVKKLDFSCATTFYEYMDIFQIDNDDIIARCADNLGIRDIHAPVVSQLSMCGDYSVAKGLLEKAVLDLAPTIIALAHEASENLLRYYGEASDIVNSKNVGLIDLGWSGSIMPPLSSIFKTVAPDVALRSYFFGLIENRKHHIPSDLRADAYFFLDDRFERHVPLQVPSGWQRADVIGASPSLMEVLLGENTTTTIGLQPDPTTGTLRAVRSKDAYSPEQRRLIAIMHEEALLFTRDALEILGADPGCWELKALLAQVWRRLLSSPDSEEARLLGAFPHRVDASGRGATATLVSSGSCNGRTALTDSAVVEWPAGWFALLDPVERALVLDKLNSANMTRRLV